MPRELIAVRSLADSDMGIFPGVRRGGRQRAININVSAARAMLAQAVFDLGGTTFRCITAFEGATDDRSRPLRRTGKNWRLAGSKFSGKAFETVDSKDFLMIRTIAGNDGTAPLFLTFLSRSADRVLQGGMSQLAEPLLRQSMAVVRDDEELFAHLARHCPANMPSEPVRASQPHGQQTLLL